MPIETFVIERELEHTGKSVEQASRALRRLSLLSPINSAHWKDPSTGKATEFDYGTKLALLRRAEFSFWLELKDAGMQEAADKILNFPLDSIE